MKKKIIKVLTDFIVNNKNCSEKDIKIYRYGIEALYNLLTKTIVMIILCSFFKTIKECLLLILTYTLLRSFAFGLHASDSLTCWITTIPIYVGGSILIKSLIIPKYIVAIIWIIYTIFVLLWAPADTKKRPLIREERRKKLKIEAMVVCIFYYIILFFTSNYLIINCIGFCMLLEATCICPLTYKITKHPFNNYLYYKGSLN